MFQFGYIRSGTSKVGARRHGGSASAESLVETAIWAHLLIAHRA